VDLILWRHAEAEDGGPDLNRRLTATGHREAARVAKWLRRRLPSEFTVVASPARRARETAEALGVTFKTVSKLAPGASVEEILLAANWPTGKKPVVVVGHQPDLGCAAAFLVSGERNSWTIKKGGLWWLESRERGKEAQVVVRTVIAPDLL